MKQGNYKEKRDTIKACKRYIDAHIQEPLDLVSLARRHALSYNAFREAFKDVADYTPHKYIRLRRVQLAAQALREGLGVTEAAELVGFETLARFYKAFLDIVGVSPQEFRSTRGTALYAMFLIPATEDTHELSENIKAALKPALRYCEDAKKCEPIPDMPVLEYYHGKDTFLCVPIRERKE